MGQIKDYVEKTTAASTDEYLLQETGGGVNKKITHANFLKSVTDDITDIQSQLGNSVNIDSSYSILDDDGYDKFYIDSSAGDIVITLPTLADNQDRILLFVVINDTNNSTIDGEGAELIDELTTVDLPKNGNYIKVIAETTKWRVINEKISCQLRLDGYAGFGSTDTKIIRFTNSRDNFGNLFSENHSTGYGTNTEGLEITINKSGNYSFAFSKSLGNTFVGLSINSAQLTTNVETINDSDLLTIDYNPGAEDAAAVSWTGYLDANDVIRAHTNGTAPGSVYFTATYLGG